MGMKKYTPNRAHFFVRKKYTAVSTERIVTLRSVNKISPESYDFAATYAADNDFDTLAGFVLSASILTTIVDFQSVVRGYCGIR
jgi:hypothetical protein